MTVTALPLRQTRLSVLGASAIGLLFSAAPLRAEAPSAVSVVRAIAEEIDAHPLAPRYDQEIKPGRPIDFSLAPILDYERRQANWSSRLGRIDPSALDPMDRTTYQILKFDLSGLNIDEAEYWLTFDLTAYQAAIPFAEAEHDLSTKRIASDGDASTYLDGLEAYERSLASLTVKLRAQMARGIYMPRPILSGVRTAWARLAVDTKELSLGPNRDSGLGTRARRNVSAKAEQIIATIRRRFATLQSLIGPAYEAKAPLRVGVDQYPGGTDIYRRQVIRYTTLDLTPEQVRDRGLSAVAEISARMQVIPQQQGFQGTARDYYDALRKDPRFHASTPAAVEAFYWRYIHEVEPLMPRYFGHLPKTSYGIARLSPSEEVGLTYGREAQPTATEPRGMYYYNGSDLANRNLIEGESTIFHELIPGHHLQSSMQRENQTLQPFRRRSSVTAFHEGWGEYAARLPIEMRLYDQPEQLYGRYASEMFFAVRLVVDTGVNCFGWSLERARRYMREHTTLSDA